VPLFSFHHPQRRKKKRPAGGPIQNRDTHDVQSIAIVD